LLFILSHNLELDLVRVSLKVRIKLKVKSKVDMDVSEDITQGKAFKL